jgi:hypothetical protein
MQGTTTAVTLNGATGFNGTRNYNALGGGGGNNNSAGSVGESGGNTTFGIGGTGGAAGSGNNGSFGGDASSPSSTSYGAGGGGGGGALNRNGLNGEQRYGLGGAGGTHGIERTVVFDLTNANNAGTLAVNIGAAGNGGTGGDSSKDGGDGAAGRGGAVAVSGVLDGYQAQTLSDLASTTAAWFTGSAPDSVNNATLNTGNNNNTVLANASANGNGVWFIASGQTIYTDGTFNINGANSWMKTNGVSGRGNQGLYSAATSFSNTQVNFYSGYGTTTQFFVEGYIDAGGNFEGKRRIQIGAYGLSEWGT